MSKILITGACGFIGHHLVEHFLKNTDDELILIDKLDYSSSGFDRLRDINCYPDFEGRIKIYPIDLQYPITIGIKEEIGNVDVIINLASESHVDNSILNPHSFILNNVQLMINLLEWSRGLKSLKKFIQFSTDEVFGPAPDGIFYQEGDRHNPGNPYSASKSSQEMICIAYANTYGLPIIITNTMNVFGERQHPEKFIPMSIKNILIGEKIKIHSDEKKENPGTRFYIHARNVADSLLFIIKNVNEFVNKEDSNSGKFNIVGEREINNLDLVRIISMVIGKPFIYELVDFHSSRPGHDLRYALSGDKLKSSGYNLKVDFQNSIIKTIEWTLDNLKWINL